MRGRDDFPGGYFDCCGRARSRGHHEACHKSVQSELATALAKDKIAAMRAEREN